MRPVLCEDGREVGRVQNGIQPGLDPIRFRRGDPRGDIPGQGAEPALQQAPEGFRLAFRFAPGQTFRLAFRFAPGQNQTIFALA